MATEKSFLQYILEQRSGLEELTYRRMMGEYILYYCGKLAAYLCDDRLLVRILPVSSSMLPDAPKQAPYEGAKEMLLVENVDDRAFLEALFRAMYSELPEYKRK